MSHDPAENIVLTHAPEPSKTDSRGRCALASGSAARCPKCNGVGYHVRVRHFDDEDADVWECQSPLCTAFGLYWHTPREKDECGKLRCALIALVKAEEASIDQFTAKEIDALERALDRANRVLYPERYSSPNAEDEPRDCGEKLKP